MRSAILLALMCAAAPAIAQEDSDLNRIPSSVENPASPSQSAPSHGKYFLEDAFSLSSWRGTFAVPYPVPRASTWANRTSLDALDQWALSDDLTVSFSDRFDVGFAEGTRFPVDAVRNDFREGYVTWEPAPDTYLEAGRINVRNGIAFGFNPTDFFKTRTRVAQSSADPSALRANRLGTVMFRGQTIWGSGALSLDYAPKLRTPTPLTATGDWIDPGFGQTNGSDRFLATLSLDVGDWDPQALIYHEGGRTKFGLNASHLVGQSIVAYGEWAGGTAPDLIARAIAFGKATGSLPAAMAALPPTRTTSTFQNDLAVGAYWTGENKVTVSLEYEFHQAGFSGRDWHDWFAIGAADPAAAPGLWYIRAYASDQQEPMSRHQAFARVSWDDAFILHLGLSAFVLADLRDGSTTAQISAGYDASDSWSIAAYAGGTFGGARSEWGSLPGAANVIFQVTRYL
ncbi:MAG: hypothetical protein KGJ78_02390 [Alphaproteobacteria bacterium]|nr:hypothetical protein [Alphaproteobacteria bacterium]